MWEEIRQKKRKLSNKSRTDYLIIKLEFLEMTRRFSWKFLRRDALSDWQKGEFG